MGQNLHYAAKRGRSRSPRPSLLRMALGAARRWLVPVRGCADYIERGGTSSATARCGACSTLFQTPAPARCPGRPVPRRRPSAQYERRAKRGEAPLQGSQRLSQPPRARLRADGLRRAQRGADLVEDVQADRPPTGVGGRAQRRMIGEAKVVSDTRRSKVNRISSHRAFNSKYPSRRAGPEDVKRHRRTRRLDGHSICLVIFPQRNGTRKPACWCSGLIAAQIK